MTDWLAGAIRSFQISNSNPPASEADRIDALLRLLRSNRCLLVLENLETLFEAGRREGRYREGMGG